MSTQTTGWDVAVPAGWTIVDPPPGIALLAVAPDDEASFRPTLVVTHQDRPPAGEPAVEPAVEDVNAWLEMLLDVLETQLDRAQVIGVWTAGRSVDAPERLATQRVLVAHRTADDVDVEMLQQHVWTDGAIVTLTATVGADADQATVDTLNACLESLTTAG